MYDVGNCIHKNHWGQGYGSEAVLLMLNWLKAQGAEKVTAEVAIENTSSNALLRKFGFEIEKESKFQKYRKPICFDSYIYAKYL